MTRRTATVALILWAAVLPGPSIAAEDASPSTIRPPSDGAPSSSVNPLYRDPAHLHYAQGLGLMASGDLLGAIAELREALRVQPDMAQARFSLGTALYLSGDVDG